MEVTKMETILCPCGNPCGAIHHVGTEPDFAEGIGENFSFAGKWHCSKECLDKTIADDTCPNCGKRGYNYKHRCEVRKCPFHKIEIPSETQECLICVALDEKNEALSLLASTTDLLNSWAREMQIVEAYDEKDIKNVVDRLWSNLSARLFRLEAESVILRGIVGRVKQAKVELDNEITVRTPTEYDAGHNSGLQSAITTLEIALENRQ
jgi:hypothetical protein